MRKLALAFSAALAVLALTAGVASAETALEAANKRIAIAFYQAALNDKDWDAAVKFIGPRYVQHNPVSVDGVPGIKQHVEDLKEHFPDNRGQIIHAFADGDIVVLHVHSIRKIGTRGNAIVDMFRIEHGKVVEHWDVVQAVPETSANTNTMF
jgi:predicted SnoaL-like aldol condensation-catalyzing enzyme